MIYRDRNHWIEELTKAIKTPEEIKQQRAAHNKRVLSGGAIGPKTDADLNSEEQRHEPGSQAETDYFRNNLQKLHKYWVGEPGERAHPQAESTGGMLKDPDRLKSALNIYNLRGIAGHLNKLPTDKNVHQMADIFNSLKRAHDVHLKSKEDEHNKLYWRKSKKNNQSAADSDFHNLIEADDWHDPEPGDDTD